MKRQTIADKNEIIRKMVSPVIATGTPANQKCHPAIAEAIESLREKLNQHYGCDYALTICGKGKIIAASNQVHGSVLAQPY